MSAPERRGSPPRLRVIVVEKDLIAGGNGFVTAPAVGKVVADLVARGGTAVDIAGLSLDRFSPSATPR